MGKKKHRPYILTESETTPRAEYTPWGMTVAADKSNLDEGELGITLPEVTAQYDTRGARYVNEGRERVANNFSNWVKEVSSNPITMVSGLGLGLLTAPVATGVGLLGGAGGGIIGNYFDSMPSNQNKGTNYSTLGILLGGGRLISNNPILKFKNRKL